MKSCQLTTFYIVLLCRLGDVGVVHGGSPERQAALSTALDAALAPFTLALVVGNAPRMRSGCR